MPGTEDDWFGVVVAGLVNHLKMNKNNHLPVTGKQVTINIVASE